MSAPRLAPDREQSWLDRLAQLGSAPLTEGGLIRYVHPLFSQTLQQARAGLAFTEAIGVERLREHSIQQQRILQERLLASGIHVDDQPEDRGAFLTVKQPHPRQITGQLMEQGIFTDARQVRLRLCPDILVTEDELHKASTQIVRFIN